MDRRGFLRGIIAASAAPAIVRVGSLMPVRSIVVPTTLEVMAVNAGWVFENQAQSEAIIKAVNEIMQSLLALGLVAPDA